MTNLDIARGSVMIGSMRAIHWFRSDLRLRDNTALAAAAARADQLALAIENVRLIAETQQRAERDRLIADITAQVRASMDVERILQTAVRGLGAALGTERAFIKLGGAEGRLPLGTGFLDPEALNNLPDDSGQEDNEGDEQAAEEIGDQIAAEADEQVSEEIE